MPTLGPTELIIIAVVIMVLFGSKKLPGAAKSLGQSMRVFKAEVKGMKDDDDEPAASPAPAPPQQLPASQSAPQAHTPSQVQPDPQVEPAPQVHSDAAPVADQSSTEQR